MPTYEYRCIGGHTFEQFQRMTDPPLDKCTQCGAPAERILSAGAGLLFKGSGFYITDYRSESYKKAAAADSGATAPADKTDKADRADKKESPPAKPASGDSSGSSSGASE